jgi:hypothetical protein
MGTRKITIMLSILLLSILACGSPLSERSAPTSTVELSPPQTAEPDISPTQIAMSEITSTQTAESDAPMPPVPDEYRAIYDNLSESLDLYQQELAVSWEGVAGNTVFGAELIVANGNRGERLLLPHAMQSVRLNLDRLQEIGVGGVSVQISDPLLRPDYPRSAEYLAYFREVAEEVQGRGLKLVVGAGPVFPDPQYSKVQFDWSNMSLEGYFQMRKDQLMLIAHVVQPDYLSLGNEPGTQMMLTGLSFSVDQYLEFVQDAATSIGRSSGVLLGAGAGSWEDPAYLEGLSIEPAIDFINIHIYPMANTHADYLERALDAADAAHARGKQVIVEETWLYKATPLEVSQLIAHQDVFERDLYSFWQPLDIQFIELMVGLAHEQGFGYLSFFWSGLFFSYLDYDETSQNLSPVELYQLLNRAQSANMIEGDLSETGKAYKALLGG